MFKTSALTTVISMLCVSLTHAASLDIDGVLIDGGGRAISLSQTEAMKACPHGTRLPTIREVAVYNQSLGAIGIKELKDIKDGKVPDGYLKIEALNPDGSKDVFYYYYRGYANSNEPKWRNPFWSSSYTGDGYGLGTYGTRGDIFGYDPSGISAVRCISK